MKSRVALVGIWISLVGSVLLPTTAFAATPASSTNSGSGTNITTSPVFTTLKVEPGKTVTTTLGVQNNALSPIGIQLELQTFKPYGTGGQAKISKPLPHSAFVSWVHFSQSSFIAEPNTWVHVQMTISPPPTAALDYYYAVLVKPVSPASLKLHTPTTTFTGYNAILTLLDVISPNAKPRLSVSNFSTNHGLYEYLPANFNVTVHNVGNIYLAPVGDIYISRDSNFKKIISTIPFNANQGNVIPGSSRVFTTQWTNGFPLFVPETVDGQPLVGGDGNPIERLTWNFSQANNFRFGRYYAKMVFVYNNGVTDVPTTAVLSFWVIPWKLGSAAVLIILLCMVGLYVSGHKVADRAARLSNKAARFSRLRVKKRRRE